MILAVDTHYTDDCATTAGLLFEDIAAPSALSEHLVRSSGPPAPYAPGEFYKRELPEILRLLDELPEPPHLIIIDGYCTLDTDGAPGLGAHLHAALAGTADIIGAAKSAFKGSAHATPLLRGKSKSPLYITACGHICQNDAARMIARMHGAHRIPDLLKRADQLCRGLAAPR